VKFSYTKVILRDLQSLQGQNFKKLKCYISGFQSGGHDQRQALVAVSMFALGLHCTSEWTPKLIGVLHISTNKGYFP